MHKPFTVQYDNTIDWHCHILPGIDDGAPSLDESVQMARLLADYGYRSVYCTPHLIKGCYDSSNVDVIEAVSVLQQRLDREGVAIQLFSGREYYLDEYLLEALKFPLPLENTDFILIEIPSTAHADLVKRLLYTIRSAGQIPVIAHPERCRLFDQILPPPSGIVRSFINAFNRKKEPYASLGTDLLSYLLDIGCQFQGNLGSFSGLYGSRAQLSANYLKSSGVYSFFATDGHSAQGVDAVLKTASPLR